MLSKSGRRSGRVGFFPIGGAVRAAGSSNTTVRLRVWHWHSGRGGRGVSRRLARRLIAASVQPSRQEASNSSARRRVALGMCLRLGIGCSVATYRAAYEGRQDGGRPQKPPRRHRNRVPARLPAPGATLAARRAKRASDLLMRYPWHYPRGFFDVYGHKRGGDIHGSRAPDPRARASRTGGDDRKIPRRAGAAN